MNSDIGTDRLSSLPKNVIESILMCMPIRDAVRTSILSRDWQYAWSTLPKLRIDRSSFQNLEGTMQVEVDRKTAKAVENVLLLHHGPIRKFTLSVDLVNCSDIGRWILFLSRNDIKEFTLDKWKGNIYKLPYSLFSCVDVTYLELFRCEIIPPNSFKGFSRLTVMDLQHVSITDDGLASLLSLCPLLESLALRHVTGCTRLKISARKLVNFTAEGGFDDIQFERMPLLATASINLLELGDDSFVTKENCEVLKVLCEAPSIYKLELLGHTLQNLAVGDVPVHLPAICPVKDLLVDINFEDSKKC